MTGVLRSDTGHETAPLDDPGETPTPADIAALIVELQSAGLRTDAGRDPAPAGPGPSDSGMLWIEGMPVTVPVRTEEARRSPYVLRARGRRRPRDLPRRRRLASVAASRRPRYYDLRPPTACRTGRSRCCTWTRWPAPSSRPATTGTPPTSAASAGSASRSTAGSTIVKKTPEQLAEVAVAARSSTARWTPRSPPGAHRARPRRALRRPVRPGGQGRLRAARWRSSSSRRGTSRSSTRCTTAGIDAVGIHVESFDPRCWRTSRRARPARASRPTSARGSALSSCSGEGRVSTYVILGMGEDPDLTVDGVQARRRHRRLPVRRSAAPGGRVAHGGRRSAHRCVHRAALPQGGRRTSPSAASVPTRRWPGAHGARRARRSTGCSTN